MRNTITFLARFGEPFCMSAEQFLVLTCTFVVAFNIGHVFYH